MSLTVPRIPASACETALRAAQDRLASVHKPGRAARAPSLYHLVAPQAVYVLDARHLTKPAPLRSVRHVGWRFLVTAENRAVAAIDVDAGQAEQAAKYSHISAGPYVDATMRAIRLAQRLSEIKAESFEVRLLKMPSIYVYALWLHSPKQDILIPFAHPSVKVGGPGKAAKAPLRARDPRACFRLLIPLAKARKPFDDSPRANPALADSGPLTKRRKSTARKKAAASTSAADQGKSRPQAKPAAGKPRSAKKNAAATKPASEPKPTGKSRPRRQS